MSGLHKRVKSDIEENFGRFKADLGLLQSDQKVTAEKIEQTEQLIERLKATNSNGTPMAQSPRAEEQKKMAKHLKQLRRQSTQQEPEMHDMREDIILLKDLFKNNQSKIDQLVSEEMSSRMRRLSPPPRDSVGISGDQLKRILGLIENNSQAMTLQRDSFNSLMVRVQLLEKSQARINLSKSASRKLELPSPMSRNFNSTVEKVAESADVT